MHLKVTESFLYIVHHGREIIIDKALVTILCSLFTPKIRFRIRLDENVCSASSRTHLMTDVHTRKLLSLMLVASVATALTIPNPFIEKRVGACTDKNIPKTKQSVSVKGMTGITAT